MLPKKQRLNMSLSYRLGEIEGAIPYEDVNPKWAKTSREKWLRALLQHGKNGTKLAELAIELLDAFTSACKEFLWDDDEGGFARVREQCARAAIAPAKKAASAEKGLREVRRAILLRECAPEPSFDHRWIATPLAFTISPPRVPGFLFFHRAFFSLSLHAPSERALK